MNGITTKAAEIGTKAAGLDGERVNPESRGPRFSGVGQSAMSQLERNVFEALLEMAECHLTEQATKLKADELDPMKSPGIRLQVKVINTGRDILASLNGA